MMFVPGSAFLPRAMIAGVDYDPCWDDVVFLSHWDSGFVDEKGHALYQGGTGIDPRNAIDSTTKKFGAGSLLWGDKAFVHTDTEADFAVDDSTPFCLEGWFYSTTDNPSGDRSLICLDLSDAVSGLFIQLRSSAPGSEGTMVIGGYSGGPQVSAAGVLVANTWQHFALVYDPLVERKLKLYVDGELAITSVTVSLTAHSTAGWLSFLGRRAQMTTAMWPGNIDEVRFTIGCPRYTTDFTPPTAPFPNS